MGSQKKLHIISLASHGEGISGGDRIWIELSRRWSKKIPITIHTWTEGKKMAERQNLKSSKTLNFVIHPVFESNFFVTYIVRILKGIAVGLTLSLPNTTDTYIYNASEFWMDALPCFILKIRFPKIVWVATWFQTAPNPFKGFAEKKRDGSSYRVSALLYWLSQLPIKPLYHFADKVIVNNEDEKKRFMKHTEKGNTIVLIGAVPLESIESFIKKNKRSTKKFDAVFQGRFHAQKGVLELVHIWEQVVKKIPNAKLAMIGDGPLLNEVKKEIKRLHLEAAITLFGYVFDGDQKYKIFSESKIVVHPAFFDSGGMATAEAMAFGIPAIGFDLKAYKSYYPSGMIRVNSEKGFSKAIIELLKNNKKRSNIGKEASRLIKSNYSWDKRSEEIFKKIFL